MTVVPAEPQPLGLPDVRDMSLRDAWDLEDRIDEAREIVGSFIDAEIRRLAGEGWTQARIAEECGRDQSRVSRRMARLKIEPARARGREGGRKSMRPHTSPELENDYSAEGVVLPPISQASDDSLRANTTPVVGGSDGPPPQTPLSSPVGCDNGHSTGEGVTGVERGEPPPPPEDKRVTAARQLVSGIAEKARHIASLSADVDPEAIRALPEEDRQRWAQQLSTAQAVLKQVSGALS